LIGNATTALENDDALHMFGFFSPPASVMTKRLKPKLALLSYSFGRSFLQNVLQSLLKNGVVAKSVKGGPFRSSFLIEL